MHPLVKTLRAEDVPAAEAEGRFIGAGVSGGDRAGGRGEGGSDEWLEANGTGSLVQWQIGDGDFGEVGQVVGYGWGQEGYCRH